MSEPLLPLREPLRPPEGYPQSPVASHDEALSARRVEGLFIATGALQRGHFLLKSGRHGDRYLEKWSLLQHPDAAAEVCALLAERALAVAQAAAVEIDLVAGPTTGGVLLAYEIGRLLGVRGIFAEEVRGDGAPRREFRRGFHIPPRARALLVDDILTTGGSLLAMLPAVEAAGGEIVGCEVLVDRSGGRSTLTSPSTGRVYPLDALWRLELPTWEPGPGTCPRCADGTALHAPGSTGTGVS